ncbi:hypothetical protein NQ318_015119 [Aromia moschata]|uniref:Meckel syndrome type 1 protein n=1 Tax=Aromia moschata TaxID=1265417 RepID=A0AAV8YZP3_9CUCU|nr:hypothetical protein NQ318_015119 [Aromia moschata]
MSPKDELTRYTAYYRCPDKIGNFKIRIRYKELDDENFDSNESVDWTTKVISWQEKRFNRSEREFYADIHNCVTDLEKKYHEQLLEEEEDAVVFTYVEEDEYMSEQGYNRPTYLQTASENEDQNSGISQKSQNEFDYTKSLFSSIERSTVGQDLEKMYIMADLGEYVENIWIKNEHPLCRIKFDKTSRVLHMYPDFTTTQPYYLKVQGETMKHFYYFIEHCSETIPENLELTEKDLIKKLTDCKISLRRQVVGDHFQLPPKNKLYVYLFFEILSAKNFEYSDVYVQYTIDLPEHWSCQNGEALRGRTQTCHGIAEDGLVHFGYCFDVVLEYDIQSLQETGIPKTPYIYFEIISKTTWDRYRTEGLTYRNLPVSKPGCYLHTLSCFRYLNGTQGNLRRFFIGDCSNYKDVRWIGLPNEYEAGEIVNRFNANTASTGQLNLRVNVLHHSQAFLRGVQRGGSAREIDLRETQLVQFDKERRTGPSGLQEGTEELGGGQKKIIEVQ